MNGAFPENATFEKNIRPAWTGDTLTREHVLAGGAKIDSTLFNSVDAVKVVVAAAGAAADALAIPLKLALSDKIPAGVSLDFGGKKFARLTAEAAKGAMGLVNAALPTALVEDDVAYYNQPGMPKRIQASTVVGCTYEELEAAAATGLKWGPAADTDEVVRIVVYDIPDADTNNDCELLRPGTLLKVNFMPSWAGLSAAVKAKVRAAYEVTVGGPGDEVPAV